MAAKKKSAPKPAHIDDAKDKAAATEHDRQVSRTKEALAEAKAAKSEPEFKELVSRDERHDSIDPTTGTLTAEAVALRAAHGISTSGEQAPKQNLAVDVDQPEGPKVVGGAMVTAQPEQTAAPPPIDAPVTLGRVNTTQDLGPQ